MASLSNRSHQYLRGAFASAIRAMNLVVRLKNEQSSNVGEAVSERDGK